MPEIVGASRDNPLAPFSGHGVNWTGRSGKQEIGDCLLCGKEGKFHVNRETGLWDCKSCGADGNPGQFVEQLWKSARATLEELAQLAEERGLADGATLARWGLVRSPWSGEWLLPGYTVSGEVRQLYRYARIPGSDKFRFLATPGLGQALLGWNGYHADRAEVWLCEGVWDGVILQERLEETQEEPVASVLATPGAHVWRYPWGKWWKEKTVRLFFDSDHPRRGPAGKLLPGAGVAGMRRAVEQLTRAGLEPRQLHYLAWGEEGFDPEQPSGYDVRDFFQAGGTVTELLGKVQPAPVSWTSGVPLGRKGAKEPSPLPCRNWAMLVEAFEEALVMTEGLNRALSVMLAAVLSVPLLGDQLWVKVMGPASCGKSTLCEAISLARQYVLAKSTIRGFHSGFRLGAQDEDNSLIAQLDGKALVTKDGDALLQSPNLEQILSEARDLYDTTARTHFRNKVAQEHIAIRMVWILCGTASLRQLDSSELGERFLDCVIMDGIDEGTEDAILQQSIDKAERNVSVEVNGEAEGQLDAREEKARRLCAGYVEHLRRNAGALVKTVAMDQAAKDRCGRLAKFVAFFRARPNPKRNDEGAERELAARLGIQLVRLAKCLGAVLNRPTVDTEVMRRVERVALDTARGQSLDMARILWPLGRRGLELAPLARQLGEGEEKLRKFLRFLRRIGVGEWVQPKGPDGLPNARVRWRLTAPLHKLYTEVVDARGNAAKE